MIDSNDLKVDEQYFLLSYMDDNLKYLRIVSLVYVGKNIGPSDYDKETWSFQSVRSFIERGKCTEINSNSKSSEDDEIEIYDFYESGLREILTLDQLIQKLHNI